jgi:hypothetical protein
VWLVELGESWEELAIQFLLFLLAAPLFLEFLDLLDILCQIGLDFGE